MPLSRINSAAIANNAVIAADIADGTITAAKIVSIANTQITGNIISSQITSVGGSQITANTIANSAFQTGSVENYMNAAGLGFGMRNRIINGAMVIDQRNAGASVSVQTTTSYTLDRWAPLTAASSKYTIQQNAGSVTPPAGFTNYLGVTVAAAANVTVGATDQYVIRQLIEGFNVADFAYGTASASTITLSFWVRSSVTGTYGGALVNSAGDRSYPFTYTISSANTWEQKSITIAGSTTGTWVTNNGNGLNISFSIGVGTTYSGTAGSWASTYYASATGAVKLIETNNATFYITGVQLEKGSTATSFDYRPYGTELQLCQRYYYQISYSTSAQTSMIGFARASTICYFNITNPVIMRTTPSIAFTGTAPAWNDGANNYALSSPSPTDNTFNNSFYASMAGATAYRPGQIFGGSGGAGVTTFSAEL